jgi:hypothetical protein
MFIALSLNRHYAAEVHPDFESVEASKRRMILEQQQKEEEPIEVQPA